MSRLALHNTLLSQLGNVTSPAVLPLTVEWYDPTVIGHMPITTDWQEISGLATPTVADNELIIWAQGDGNRPFLLAVNVLAATSAGKYTLTGVTNVDNEDLASAKVGGVSYLYLADIGDNGNARTDFDIYRILEPVVIGGDQNIGSGDIEKINCIYDAITPPTHKDAECLLVDPLNGDMYIITKREAAPGVYRLLHAASYTGQQTFTFLGDMSDIPDVGSPSATGNVVGGCVSPDGSEILIKSYDVVYHFPRAVGSETIFQALSKGLAPVEGYVGGGTNTSHGSQEPQGEAICFDFSGLHFFTASEFLSAHGSGATSFPLFHYARASSLATIVDFQDGVLPTAGYGGTRDTYIWDLNPDVSYGTETTFVSDLNVADERRGLIRFDISSISTGATVIGAYLDLFIAVEGQGWVFYKVLVPWEETSTYNSLTGGINPDDVDASSTPECDIGRNLNLLTIHTRNNIAVSTVQSWVTTPSSNYGWLVVPTHATNGQQHASRTAVAAGNRPRLRVRYI